MPRCKVCKSTKKHEEMVEVKSRVYVCIECEEEYKNNGAKKTDRELLIDYVYELYDHNIPVLVHKQIKDFVEKKGYKHSGILLTLKYIYEIEGKVFDDSYGIGLVEYTYDKAKELYIKKLEIAKMVEEFDIEDDIKTVKVNVAPKRKIRYNID